MSLVEPLSLVLEQCALFAIWNHTRRRERLGWLVAGCVILAVAAALLAWLPASAQAKAYLLFAACYLLSALAWSSLIEGLSLRDWMLGEIFVAVLASAIIVTAASLP